MKDGIIRIIFETEEEIEIASSSAPGDDRLYQNLAKILLAGIE